MSAVRLLVGHPRGRVHSHIGQKAGEVGHQRSAFRRASHFSRQGLAADPQRIYASQHSDRYGCVTDPFGHSWAIMSRVEDLTPEQIGARAAKMFGGQS